MVTYPPLAPSASWFSNYLKSLLKDKSEREAIIESNSFIYSPKEFGRYQLRSPKGEDFILSVAVEGGGRQLRDLSKIEGLKLSEHGDWRKTHLGAIESALGRKPFFRHLEDDLKKIYGNKELQTLEGFNTAIFQTLKTFLIGDIRVSELKDIREGSMVYKRGKEIAIEIEPHISMLQALSEKGREALMGILTL